MHKKEKVVLLGLLLNVLLSIIKFTGGILSGSVGLVADAIHSSSDVIASLSLFVGVRLSNRKTKSFPYGTYKLENLISLFTSFAIFFAGYEIVKEVFLKMQYEVKYISVAISIEAIAVLITFLFSKYELKMGKITESPALIADSKHIRSDMFSSIIIIMGLIGSIFHFHYFDKVAAIIVAILIFRAGYEVALDSIRVLLDASIDFETLNKVREIILKYPFVVGIKELKGRNSGSFKFLEAVIIIKGKNLKNAHKIVSSIEDEIKSTIPHVDSVIIHYEPSTEEIKVISAPVNELKEIDAEFGGAPYFIFLSVRKSQSIDKIETLKNPFRNAEKAKGIRTAEWLVKKGVDILFLKKEIKSPGPQYLLSDYGVEVYVFPDITLDKIMRYALGKTEKN